MTARTTIMANEQMHYLQQVNQMRQQRAQQEYQQRVQEAQANYYTNLQYRQEIEKQAAGAADEYERAGLLEQWNALDREVQQAEHDLQALMPAQRPQDPPQWRAWAARHKHFFDRYGDRAKQAIQTAHNYLVRPKNPRETNLDRRGMGLQPFSEPYFRELESLLELYGADSTFQTRFDPKEAALTPDEAAEASGLSAREYNKAVVELRNQGRLGQDD
jgi:hypothetical protein